MRPTRPKFTIFRAALPVAVAALLCFVVAGPIKRLALDRHGRLLEIATNHKTYSPVVPRNAGGNPDMVRVSAWHDQMRREFERADHPDEPSPQGRPFPPGGRTADQASVVRE